MYMTELIVITGAAVATSILSAVAGLGGGVILLMVIAQFVSPTTAIPIQGAIQLVSNGTRATILRRDIDRRAALWSSLLVLPGALLGVAVATSLPDDAIRIVLAGFVLVLAWRPDLLKARVDPDRSDNGSRNLMIGVGAASGLVNGTVGASGPVTSPLFRAITATHVAFVATAAAAQVVGHIAKLIAFSANGWSVSGHLDVIALGAVGVIAGSFIGTRLLGRVTAQQLDLVFKVVLTALAIRLIIVALT